jgi:hypothetical protein
VSWLRGLSLYSQLSLLAYILSDMLLPDDPTYSLAVDEVPRAPYLQAVGIAHSAYHPLKPLILPVGSDEFLRFTMPSLSIANASYASFGFSPKCSPFEPPRV